MYLKKKTTKLTSWKLAKHHEILIDRCNWKPGNNSRTQEFLFKWNEDIIVNALALSQKREDAYKSMIQKLSNKIPLAQIHKELPHLIHRKRYKKVNGFQR